jgi:hypothetical protein
MIQVEPKGEFHPDALRVLDMKEKFLQNQSVMQVKLQWKHFGVDEATWELEYSIRVAYPFFFMCKFVYMVLRTPRIVFLKGEANVTPRFPQICNYI